MFLTVALAVISLTALAANEQVIRTSPEVHPSATRQSDYLKEPYDLESLIASLPIQYQQDKAPAMPRARTCQGQDCSARNGAR